MEDTTMNKIMDAVDTAAEINADHVIIDVGNGKPMIELPGEGFNAKAKVYALGYVGGLCSALLAGLVRKKIAAKIAAKRKKKEEIEEETITSAEVEEMEE